VGQFIGLTIAGLSLGAIYAIAASGLVVTYTTSGVFNFSHGAIGMIMAFVYWQLRVQEHWPAPFAIAITLLVIAPVLGVILQWALIKRININDAGLTLVVTLAVMVMLMGVSFTIWPPTAGRLLPLFFGPSRHLSIGGNLISYEELIAIALAAATALGLRLLFFNTRIGVAMRGVVDDRQLMALNGGNPAVLNALSWMIGASLGAVAGILTASTYQLDVLNLTLLVLNSFAAAMLGRLRNLPLTFVGALVLGLADAYVTGYLKLSGWLVHLRPVLPTLFLFIVLLALPSVRLRAGTAPLSRAVGVPGCRRSLANGAVLIAAAMIAAPMLHGTVLGNVSAGVALGIGALSIVLLSGYGGQISLAQYTFLGLGAWLFARTGHGGSPLGLLVAAVVGAGIGALVAIPAIRLRGLELALSTLAFGQLAYYMFFLQPQVMGRSDLLIPRLRLPGLSLANDRANLVFLAVVFAVLSAGVLTLRRGLFGHILVATKDSQAACATMGLNLRITKVLLFSLATAIATFGGALYGSTQRVVTSDNFQYVASLFIVLIVYIWGVSTPGAALAGGLSLALAPILALHIPTRFQAVTYFLTGFGALVLVQRPEGLIPSAVEWFRQHGITGLDPRGPLIRPLRVRPDARPSIVEVSGAAAADG
jgi:branched-chain amino acid transport system permease protein